MYAHDEPLGQQMSTNNVRQIMSVHVLKLLCRVFIALVMTVINAHM